MPLPHAGDVTLRYMIKLTDTKQQIYVKSVHDCLDALYIAISLIIQTFLLWHLQCFKYVIMQHILYSDQLWSAFCEYLGEYWLCYKRSLVNYH